MITDQILQGHGPHYRWLRVPVNTWLALHVLVNLNPSESDSTPNLLFSSRSRSDLGRSIVRRINLPPPRDQCRRIARMESRSPPQRNRQYRSGFQDGSSPSPSPPPAVHARHHSTNKASLPVANRVPPLLAVRVRLWPPLYTVHDVPHGF